MRTVLGTMAMMAIATMSASAQGQFVHGTVKKIDQTAKTVAVRERGREGREGDGLL